MTPVLTTRRLTGKPLEDFAPPAPPLQVEDPEVWPEPKGEEPKVNLTKLAEDLTRKPLSEIAALVRTLTYGEMIELAEGIWKCRPEDAEVSAAAELPAILHRWSEGRKCPTKTGG